MKNAVALLVLLLSSWLMPEPVAAGGAQLAIAPLLAGALIGGGVGLVKGLFGKAPKTTQQTTQAYNNQANFNNNTSFANHNQNFAEQGLDANSQAYVNQNRQLGQAGANMATANPSQWFTGPQQMSIGDQAGQFMNPYMQNVIDPMRAQFDRMRTQASNSADRAASAAGSFGGSRHALIEGAQRGAVDAAEGQQLGNLMYGGYQNALQQGVAYTEQQRQLQEQQMQAPLWAQGQAIGMMNQAMGPTGQVSSSNQSQTGTQNQMGASNENGMSRGTQAMTGQKPGVFDSMLSGAASGAMFGNAFGGGGGYGMLGNQAAPQYAFGTPGSQGLQGGQMPGFIPPSQIMTNPWMR